jgi:CHAD domain-containing protein
MKTKLKPGGRLSRRVRRMFRREMAGVVTGLANGHDESVHAARKGIKKVRSSLRLARPALKKKVYRREQAVFRKAGQALAGKRDAEVLLDTLKKLQQEEPEAINGALTTLEQQLHARHKGAGDSLKPQYASKEAVILARRRAKDWPLEKVQWADLCNGLRRTYERGREAFGEAERQRTPENLHAWRKRVKDLAHQLHIIEPACPHFLSRLAQESKLLGEILGDDHDLALLTAEIKLAKLAKEPAQALSKIITLKQLRLQHTAFELGRRLYQEMPRDFCRRIKGYGEGCWD